jgi:hypothetical protein
MSFSDYAKELADAFISDKRTNGDTFYKLADKRPDWIDSEFTQRIHSALDERFPCDWVYSSMASIADTLGGYTHHNADEAREDVFEIADGLVDVYTSDLMGWLQNGHNRGLVEMANDEMGQPADIEDQAKQGQYYGLSQIAGALIDEIDRAMGEQREAELLAFDELDRMEESSTDDFFE